MTERGSVAAYILNVGTRVVSFTPRWKKPQYPSDGRLGGPQSRSGRGGEGSRSLHIPGS